MGTAKAAMVESISKRRRLRGLPSRLRPASPSQRLEKIKEMASAMLEQAESLDHEQALAEISATAHAFDPESGIDFFEEVRRFETQLITRALKHAGGNQARAARLLSLGATTLNYKIKTYGLLQGSPG